jgi:acyl-CoA thioesterase
MTSFAEDMARTPAGEGEWQVELAERWNVGRNQNGGVLLATAAGALGEVLGQPHPFAVTGHYLGAAGAGPATVRAATIKPGRTYASGTAELWQDERERVRVIGAFGDLGVRATDGPSMFPAEPPSGPPPDRCDDLFELLVASVGERALTRSLRNFEIRVDPGSGWGGAGGDEPSLQGWIRFRDEPTVTPLMLLAAADGFPPSLLGRAEMGWLPTIELTVHVFGAPPADEPWLRAVLRTRSVVGGLLDEDGELWDASGALVARFRQLAMLIPRDTA